MKLRQATANRRTAFTLAELLVTITIVSLLAVIFLPAVIRSKARSGRVTCVNNLKQIGLSFRIWPTDSTDRYPMEVPVTKGGTMELITNTWPHFQVMSNELSTPRVLICPQDTRRTNALSFQRGFGDTNISYFVGVDAREIEPQRFLSGDDNLAVGGTAAKSGLLTLLTNSPVSWIRGRHKLSGNISGNIYLADGSVHEATDQTLRQLLSRTGIVTNRLVLP
jgi:prepilin-type N-terminal cleavage/methylation domain-containing protein